LFHAGQANKQKPHSAMISCAAGQYIT